MHTNVQIYATLGPSCALQETLERMFQTGLSGMRLNLSHTGLLESREIVSNFRMAALAAGVRPQLLIDMQGPELRVGRLEEPLFLQEGERILLTDAGDSVAVKSDLSNIHIPIPAAALQILEEDDEVLLNDGRLSLQVLKVHLQQESRRAECIVRRGGALSSHKSVKVVGKEANLPVLTEHDIENLRMAGEYGVTGLMQPFVRSGADLRAVRRALLENDAGHVRIFAKIENRAALACLDDIINEADVIIIARGDLGNDMELWELPAVQKDIANACKKAGKPFIVVTQMLASMEESPVPTRAEVSDIFNAVTDGAYGVMITGESAAGKYPVEAVKYLANTARVAEGWMKSSKNMLES